MEFQLYTKLGSMERGGGNDGAERRDGVGGGRSAGTGRGTSDSAPRKRERYGLLKEISSGNGLERDEVGGWDEAVMSSSSV